MTRMSRDFLGGPGSRPSASNTCMVVTTLFVLVTVAAWILQAIGGSTQCPGGQQRFNSDSNTVMVHCPDDTWEEQTTTFQVTSSINAFLSFGFWLYMLIAVCRTRAAMRQKYNIPPGCCGDLDDCCCTCWCGCCTVSARVVK